jgi:hypothetical protein
LQLQQQGYTHPASQLPLEGGAGSSARLFASNTAAAAAGATAEVSRLSLLQVLVLREGRLGALPLHQRVRQQGALKHVQMQ